jgi:hypothetical protein
LLSLINLMLWEELAGNRAYHTSTSWGCPKKYFRG